MPHTYKNKLGNKIIAGIEAGAELSVSEWAEELHVENEKIRQTLSELRKRGYLFYPLNSTKGKGETQGKVVSILRKDKYIQELTAKHDQTYLIPHLESAFRIIELALPKFPDMHKQIQNRLHHLAQLIGTEARTAKKILNNAYEYTEHPHR